MQKKGYIYAELTVTNPEAFYREYMPRVKPVLEKFGAVFLVATDAPEVIEGDRVVPRIILIEFPSAEVARDFYNSPEYQEIIEYRFESSSAHLYILEGL
ncbi:DUF1330 domain-containing protein [Pseudomonas fulva]|uniref:DUF1330 domain-containing protein n=1 Tax=Pseudomonas fulva TaxID=47880 RepID=UPI003D2EA7FB